ncbi:MAG: GHKL domain-containing protein [Brachymonas sp.]|nr:GHKL domain-containing protein [Brachymonas sp.]
MALALSNLLENALDFSPDLSEIRIELQEEAQQIHLSVQDAGLGVPDFAVPRLGERFFKTPRPEGSSRSQKVGSGLGLSIVQSIVRLHGGQLILRNTSPGFRAEMILPK